ncbi:MAG: Ig-like domain-containing protein [Gammaproteobacteria bacterium]
MSADKYSSGSAVHSDNAGAQLRYTFTGAAVRWIGYRDIDSGIADVYLDGRLVSTVDTYSSTPRTQVVLYSATGLAAGSHTLALQVEGRHDPEAAGSSVWVDSIDTLPSSTSSSATGGTLPPPLNVTYTTSSGNNGYTRIEQDDSAVNYSGSWETEGSSLLVNYSGGTAAESSDASAQVSLAFSGTAVRWIGYRDTFSGVANVYLDGAHVATVDTYGTLPQSQVTLYSASGLAAGSHTLTIRPTGTHRLLALGSAVWVDAFDILPIPQDTTPPTVSMTAPANGAAVSNTITVSASASDDVGVAGVQFELDGTPFGAEDAVAPYTTSWDTTAVANGTHTLTAVARDAAGNSTTASPVTVTVSNSTQPPPDTTPPTVSMTAPADGSTVSNTVTVSASASDNVGVAGVQFELDGAALGAEDATQPYAISWDSSTVANGSHTLTAIAYDNAGNQTTATPVTVTVSNSTGGGGGTTRIEQDNPAITYTGTWVTGSDSSVSGGSAAESNQAHATATLTFNGTGVSWISYRCTCTAGISNVSLDGGSPTQVDTYSAQTQPQAVVYSVSNLPKGTHTLSIEVTGTYDPNGQTAYVAVDAFDITP